MSNDPTRSSRLFFTIMIVPMVMGISSISRAQSLSPSVGFFGGYGWHTEQGWFNADCGCTFEGGTGKGFVGGAFFELPITRGFSLGLQAGVDFKNFANMVHAVDNVVVQGANSGIDTQYGFSIDRINSAKMTYLMFNPYIQYEFFSGGPFAQVGPGASLLLSSRYTLTRHIVNPTPPPGFGLTGPLRFASSGTSDETVQDSEIRGANTLRLSAIASVGWNIPVWGFTIAPMITYDFPLTTISDQNASGWKVASFYGSIAIKFGL